MLTPEFDYYLWDILGKNLETPALIILSLRHSDTSTSLSSVFLSNPIKQAVWVGGWLYLCLSLCFPTPLCRLSALSVRHKVPKARRHTL
ncbi:hypothetical protein E2C01_059391 [Portunus trituberculatus]|uniref:Uncharacterized protein n=1 Tax=Portunus trituberculatus TaxID=210409 RepID=A0A5B7H881_PORTR|nr:hypothetical protein [Portunus trituberculatus]